MRFYLDIYISHVQKTVSDCVISQVPKYASDCFTSQVKKLVSDCFIRLGYQLHKSAAGFI